MVKPRSKAWPLTDEDWAIWWRDIPESARWHFWMFLRGQNADRRDAELMCTAQYWRQNVRRTGCGTMWVHEIAVGGNWPVPR